MTELTITGLSRVPEPKPNKGGSIVLAWFDCQVSGFSLRGCAFVRTVRRGLTVWPPKLDGREGGRCSVFITDEHLRKAMVTEAQTAYRALGGTDGEWIRPEESDADEAAERFSRENGQAEPERRAIPVRRTVTKVEPADGDEGVRRFLDNA